jgi:protein gp37
LAGAVLPLPNAWIGVSAEDDKRAALRIPALAETPAAIRFVSAEPLLGPGLSTSCSTSRTSTPGTTWGGPRVRDF